MREGRDSHFLYADETASIFNNAELWWIANCVFSGFDSLFEYVNTGGGTAERGDAASCFPIKFPDKTTLVGSGGATRRVGREFTACLICQLLSVNSLIYRLKLSTWLQSFSGPVC